MKKRCIMVLADGARPDVFESLLGELPNINRYIISRGCFKYGVTSFPSTTGPAYLPLLTGCHPGTCNLPGIRWFDKDVYAKRPWSLKKFRSYVGPESFHMNRDFDKNIPTLFDLFPRSVNIFSSINRGVPFRGNKTAFFRIWHWYYAHLTDHWETVDDAARRKMMASITEDLQFLFVVFPGIDEYSHIASPFGESTKRAYIRLDDAVGSLGRYLEEKGWLDETLLIIVSDHGLSETKVHFPLDQWLEKMGMRTFFYPVIFKWGFSCANMVSGNGMSHLYFSSSGKPDRPRRRDWIGVRFDEDMSPRQKDILKMIRDEEAVDIMVTRSRDGGLFIYRSGKKGHVYSGDGKIFYERIDGDPLGYDTLPEALSPDGWLEATISTEYPDALMQVLQITRSPRAGDVILSARKGYDLREKYEVPEHKASHGSLHREHMMIPVASSVPLPCNVLRAVDVFPTVCKILGKEWPHRIDGVPRVS